MALPGIAIGGGITVSGGSAGGVTTSWNANKARFGL